MFFENYLKIFDADDEFGQPNGDCRAFLGNFIDPIPLFIFPYLADYWLH